MGSARKTAYGTAPDGQPVEACTLSAGGLEVTVIGYGASVTSLRVPDSAGAVADVVLGFDDLAGFTSARFFNTVVGRYPNRIAQARFTLDGKVYTLAANDAPHHLHGGPTGFHRQVWKGEVVGDSAVRFTLTSPDGHEGYPGTVRAEVTYAATERREVTIDYAATTDKPTPIGFTQHAYFNLAGKGDVLSHWLTIAADEFTPVDARLIPTGRIAPVEGTPLDFRREAAVGARIDDRHEQLAIGGGYDHNFVLRRTPGKAALAARLVDPTSGRTMEVHTTEPGVQLYTGNKLRGQKGRGGAVYGPRAGLCLETQPFPDSPNRPEFPSVILRPGQTLRSRTVWAFGAL